MASRMIHYTISELITDKINFNNKNRFLIGSLAPDMAGYEHDSHIEGIHESAHFMERSEELGLRGINWLKFYNKYLKDNIDDEFALGYFVHLICDAIWLSDIQAKYIYTITQETRERTIMKGYEDMRKCNYHMQKSMVSAMTFTHWNRLL